MSTKDELVFNYVLLAFQVSLGIWQFIKITPVGALIKGTIGWLLRPLGLFPVYARLQSCRGRVFKKANCFVLQVDIPSERLGILRDENNTINLHYLGNESVLERKGMDGNMLYRDGKMCYYITRRIWEELQTLGEVVSVGILESRTLASAATFAAAAAGRAALAVAKRAAAERTAAYGIDISHVPHAEYCSPFGRGSREFWEEVITGGVMSLEEILDGVILYNQHVSLRVNDDWLLPINLSVSEEKLLKIINLLGLFLQTKTVKVHWLIPTSLSLISALMEFSTTIRVWIHTNINVVFGEQYSACSRVFNARPVCIARVKSSDRHEPMHAPSPIARVRSSDAHSPCMLHRPSIGTVYNTLHAKHSILYIARPPCPPSERPRRPSTVLGGSLQIPMEQTIMARSASNPAADFLFALLFEFQFQALRAEDGAEEELHTRERTPHQRAIWKANPVLFHLLRDGK